MAGGRTISDYRFCKDDDLTKVFAKICGNTFDDDVCSEFSSDTETILKKCGGSEFCVDGECKESTCFKYDCREFGDVHDFDEMR